MIPIKEHAEYSVTTIEFNDITKGELPSKGVFLDNDVLTDGADEYIERLKFQQRYGYISPLRKA